MLQRLVRALLSMARMWQWLLLAALTLYLMATFVPHQMPGLLWNLGKVSLGLHLGYWADRNLFPYARPDQPQLAGISVDLAMMRRAVIVAAVVIGLGLGV